MKSVCGIMQRITIPHLLTLYCYPIHCLNKIMQYLGINRMIFNDFLIKWQGAKQYEIIILSIFKSCIIMFKNKKLQSIILKQHILR